VLCLSHAFDQKCETHASANTKRRETKPRSSLLHLAEQGCGYAHSRTAYGMAQRDRASVYWAAKASLSSIKSMAFRLSCCLSRSVRMAGTGPIPMISGATPVIS